MKGKEEIATSPPLSFFPSGKEEKRAKDRKKQKEK